MAQARKRGIKSSAQDNFLEPHAPTIGTLTDVGTNRLYNDGAATITFTPASTGPAATSFKVYNASTDAEIATGSSSPITISGLPSNSGLTVYVKAFNSVGGSPKSSNSNNITVTTVPATPSAPTATSPAPSAPANQAGATQDVVSWSAPANGGKSISNYGWESNDSKSGETAGTSVTVNQEGNTTQQYRVRAYNANGWSSWSPYSSNVTTFSFTPYAFTPVYSFTPVFSFVPFSFVPYAFTPVYQFVPQYQFTPVYQFVPVYSFTPVFSFVPYSFTPVYSFVPYSFTPFSFTPSNYAFTPSSFSFTPFGFTPQSYAFVPYSFTPSGGGGGTYTFAPWFYG